ncbi:hypothetical protein SprV_0702424100 [Sparganum proliferum]
MCDPGQRLSQCDEVTARIGPIEQCTKLPKITTAASTTAPVPTATPTTTAPTLTGFDTIPRAPPPPNSSTFIMSSTIPAATTNTPPVTGRNAPDTPAATTTTFTTTTPVSTFASDIGMVSHLRIHQEGLVNQCLEHQRTLDDTARIALVHSATAWAYSATCKFVKTCGRTPSAEPCHQISPRQQLQHALTPLTTQRKYTTDTSNKSWKCTPRLFHRVASLLHV